MTLEPIYELPEDRIPELEALYRSYEWWADRDVDDVRRAYEHTDCFVGLCDGEIGKLIAAARVLTDFVYYGTIYDVIVAEERRGSNVGHQLLEAVTAHPSLSSVDVLGLYCREGLSPFYEDCGFVEHEMVAPLPDGTEEDLVPMRYDFDESA